MLRLINQYVLTNKMYFAQLELEPLTLKTNFIVFDKLHVCFCLSVKPGTSAIRAIFSDYISFRLLHHGANC